MHPKDNQLHTKISLLKESYFFRGLTDMEPMVNKQQILLVLTGHKPVAEVYSAHWESTATGRRAAPDDPEQLATFLVSLGLAYDIKTTEYAANVIVARSHELIDGYLQGNGSKHTGELLGYPETAIAAFDSSDSMPIIEQAAIEQKESLESFSPFRLSKKHWHQELVVIQNWLAVIRNFGFEDDNVALNRQI